MVVRSIRHVACSSRQSQNPEPLESTKFITRSDDVSGDWLWRRVREITTKPFHQLISCEDEMYDNLNACHKIRQPFCFEFPTRFLFSWCTCICHQNCSVSCLPLPRIS
jgi:hypothetical protein